MNLDVAGQRRSTELGMRRGRGRLGFQFNVIRYWNLRGIVDRNHAEGRSRIPNLIAGVQAEIIVRGQGFFFRLKKRTLTSRGLSWCTLWGSDLCTGSFLIRLWWSEKMEWKGMRSADRGHSLRQSQSCIVDFRFQ